MINWKVRIKNKAFWCLLIPAVAVAVQAILEVFGIVMDFTPLVNKLINVVEAIFVLLGILGIVVDPTTAGVSDSKRAMSYTEPWKDTEVQPPDVAAGGE